MAAGLGEDGGGLGPWEEVHKVDDAIIVDVAGLQDIGRWQVLLSGDGQTDRLVSRTGMELLSLRSVLLGWRRANTEESPLILI